jgi:predicted protein tyrosine phosphatase
MYKNMKDAICDLVLFNKEHAKKIISFLDKINEEDDGDLIIHCDLGISRSAAVAMFSLEYFGLDESVLHTENNIKPNIDVLSVLRDTAGVKIYGI